MKAIIRLITTYVKLNQTYLLLKILLQKMRGRALPFNEFDNIIKVLDQSFSGDGSSNTRIDRDIVRLEVKATLTQLTSIA